jgi:predicted AlkP superfamily pyrophosphatase or phosphodiesterase
MRIRAFAAVLVLLLLGVTSSAPAPVSVGSSGQIVVLVGLDGFHPNYMERERSRHLRDLASRGVQARWLTPVFPTLTFPNFYSIATGLYPEHHGIVSNTIKDRVLGRFALRDTAAVRDPRWWGGEPIWVTALKQGRRAATYFWPGSEAPIGGVHPTYYKLFNPRIPDRIRVQQVLDWLSLPPERAPALITLYLGDVDEAGHRFGPSAPETDLAIARVDSAVGALMSGIEQRRLSGRVNLIVVSDHGMAEVPPDHFIFLDDFVDPRSVDLVDLGPIVSLSARPGTEDEVYRRLIRVPHLRVYHKNEIPAAFHYRVHSRIQPIVAVAEEGWMVSTRSAASRSRQPPRGMHGYPPDLPSMHALFLAAGPAFSRGRTVNAFQNIHLYDLIAHVLEIKPAPNDGSLDSVRMVLSR